MRSKPVIVLKFGGSVISGREGFFGATEYATKLLHGFKPLLVVSAPKGVTSLLENLYGKVDRNAILGLRKRYAMVLAGISDEQIRQDASEQIESALRSLEGSMDYDQFVSQGEDHSGLILTHFLESLGYESLYMNGYNAGILVDSRGIIKERLSISNVRRNLTRYLEQDNDVIPIIGGFVGRQLDTAKYRLLGRNSTDVTGAIVAAATDADYEIIKDVPGIYFVEPEFRKSHVIPLLSYEEAGELAWRGIEAVHPIAVRIAKNNDIPIRVKSLHDKTKTLITGKSASTRERPIAGISARRFYLLNISDELMNTSEGRGYLSTVTGILSSYGIDIYDVATSANVISVTIHPRQNVAKNEKIEIILTKCLEEHNYRPSVRGKRIGAISIVGKALKENTEIISRLTSLFHRNRIGIRMISKGDSQNLIFGIEEKGLVAAVNLLYGELFS